MNDETTKIREGDIYSWRWADPKRDADRGSYGSYHCCSCIAVVHGGKLVDTYWFGGGNKILDPSSVEICLLGNVADCTEIRPHEIAYYRREDIIDMRHANNSSGPIYLRKGATRDAAAIMGVIEHGIETYEREIKFAKQRIEHLQKNAERVLAGELDEVFL